jgi:O-phospho-L-seryl-tRNASec:L-selenocysteinyl-tRNA synthase
MLFMRCVSGTRVVPLGQVKSVGHLEFQGYGAHVDAYPVPYLTAACVLGVRKEEVEEFLVRLDRTMGQFKRRHGGVDLPREPAMEGGQGAEGGGEGGTEA